MFDSKVSLISSIISGKDIVNSMNKQNEDQKGYLTYITNTGWITGKEYDIHEVDISSEEKIVSTLEELKERGKGLDSLSLAVSMYNAKIERMKEDYNLEVNESNRAIFLEDVSIKVMGSKVIKVNVFVLFSDQISGVIPGKVDLEALQ